MDKYFKPKQLTLNPWTINADQKSKHWKAKFENFLEELDAAEEDKLKLLINFVDYSIHEDLTAVEDNIQFEILTKKHHIDPGGEIITSRNCYVCRALVDIPVYNFTSTQRGASWKKMLRVSLGAKDLWPFDRAIWYTSFIQTESLLFYKLCFYLLHVFPGLFLDKLAVWSGGKPRLMKIYNRIRIVSKSLWYFQSRHWVFQNDNTVNLWNNLDPEDKVKFHFDVSDVDEAEQFYISKLGVKYFYLKESLEDTTKAERKNTILYWAHQVLKAGCYLIALKVMVCVAHLLPL